MNEFAARYAEAWCSQDPARVAGFFSEAAILSVNGAEPAVGHSAIAEVARGFMADFPDMLVVCDGPEERKNRILFHWTLAGRNTGPGGTGHKVRISGFEEWRMGADGLIAESKGHIDEAEYQRQIKFGYDESPR